jgi:hypothetical protein
VTAFCWAGESPYRGRPHNSPPPPVGGMAHENKGTCGWSGLRFHFALEQAVHRFAFYIHGIRKHHAEREIHSSEFRGRSQKTWFSTKLRVPSSPGSRARQSGQSPDDRPPPITDHRAFL